MQPVDSKRLIVHTMGRVGSFSLLRNLSNIGQFDVFHTHYLAGGIDGARAKNQVPDSGHIKASSTLLGGPLDGARFIVLLRDPIARNLSAFFHNLGRFGIAPDQDPRDAEQVSRAFVSKYPHEIPKRWIRSELRGFLGIRDDLQEVKKAGGAIFSGGGYPTLVAKLDTDVEIMDGMLSDFLETDATGVSERRLNAASDKEYFELYRAVQEVKLPRDLVDSVLGADWCSQVFSVGQLEALRAKWT